MAGAKVAHYVSCREVSLGQHSWQAGVQAVMQMGDISPCTTHRARSEQPLPGYITPAVSGVPNEGTKSEVAT